MTVLMFDHLNSWTFGQEELGENFGSTARMHEGGNILALGSPLFMHKKTLCCGYDFLGIEKRRTESPSNNLSQEKNDTQKCGISYKFYVNFQLRKYVPLFVKRYT